MPVDTPNNPCNIGSITQGYAAIKQTHLSRAEVQDILGLSRKTVSQMLIDGKFPNAFRLESGYWRIPESDIAAWIQRRQQATPRHNSGQAKEKP